MTEQFYSQVYTQEMKTYVHTKTCMQILVTALFIIVKKWKLPKYSSTDELMNKMWCIHIIKYSVQFSSVSQSCPTLCDHMNCSTQGVPVHHQLPESTQSQVHCVGDATQPSHPLLSPSPPTLNLSQHQGLYYLAIKRMKYFHGIMFLMQTPRKYSFMIKKKE